MSNLNYDETRVKLTEERVLMESRVERNKAKVKEIQGFYDKLDLESITKLRNLGVEVALPEIDYERLRKDDTYKLQILTLMQNTLDNIDSFIRRYV